MSGCGARTAAGSLEAVFELSDVERFGHLLKSPTLDKSITTYTGPANSEVEKISYARDTVWHLRIKRWPWVAMGGPVAWRLAPRRTHRRQPETKNALNSRPNGRISFHFVRKGPARRSLVRKTPASGWDRPSNGLELPVRVLQSEIANRVTSPPANHCERKPAARRVTPASLRWNARSAQISPKVLPRCASITARRSSSASRR